MPKIIISYRRSDSDAIAGRIRDKLAGHYGESSVFMDIDNIPFGIDFRDHIRDALFENDMLIVVVGPRWVGQGKGGHLRIQEETDPVRIEVETALERGIPVIPVLVNNAAMPKPSELPDSLRNFAYRNAAEVDAGRDFHQHMDRLIRSMDKVLIGKGAVPPPAEVAPPPPPPPAMPATPLVEAPSIAAAPEREPAPPTPRADPLVPAAAAATSAYQPPPTTGGNTTAAYPPPKPQRLGLIIALAAGGSAVLAAAMVAGGMFFYAPRMTAVTPPPVAPPAPAPQLVAPPAPPAPPPAPVVSASTAASCKPHGTPAFYDDFKTADPGWNLTDKNETYYADGQLAVKAETNTTWAIIYRSLLYKNATVCANIKTPPVIKAMDKPGAGVIFWAADYRNYYVVLTYADGSYLISRKINGTWANVAPKRMFEGARTGLGVVNQIKVTTVGNVATVFINDRKVQDLKGQPPKNGGAVGVFGESEKEQVNEWRYLDIGVTELPANAPAPSWPAEASVKALLANCKLSGTAAFADDFKAVDTAWIGVPSESAYLVEGQLRIKAAVNSTWRIAYWGLVFKDINVCAEIKAPASFTDAGDTAGGVIFWGTDFDNYYSINIYADGSYAIDRRVAGQVVKVAPKAVHAAIKKGQSAENRVKVTIAGSLGTLFVNDVKVQDFRGQPPPSGSSVGLFGESEAKERAEWGYSGIVVTEGS
jgi:TIR domain